MAAATGASRRRRLTLSPNGLSSEGVAHARADVSGSCGGARFDCLQDASSSDEEDCLSEVPF